MNILHLKTLFWTSLLGITGTLLLDSCVNYPQETWVVNVTDMKSNIEKGWDLVYDYKGRLTRYGGTSICYDDNKIIVGKMEWDCKKEKQFSAIFRCSDDKVNSSESFCILDLNGDMLKVHKKTDYFWKEDTLFINSYYKTLDDEQLLRTIKAYYLFDEQHRLTEIISRYYNEVELEISSCHSYLEYNSPIAYEANLNLLAYIVDREELDTFLFFLLYMNQNYKSNILPSQIRHCVNRGESTYVADCLYRMSGERLVRMEIVSEYVELKERIDFRYYEK